MTELLEEWVAFPDKRKYVPVKEHFKQGNEGGWWATGWKRTDDGQLVPPEPAADEAA